MKNLNVLWNQLFSSQPKSGHNDNNGCNRASDRHPSSEISGCRNSQSSHSAYRRSSWSSAHTVSEAGGHRVGGGGRGNTKTQQLFDRILRTGRQRSEPPVQFSFSSSPHHHHHHHHHRYHRSTPSPPPLSFAQLAESSPSSSSTSSSRRSFNSRSTQGSFSRDSIGQCHRSSLNRSISISVPAFDPHSHNRENHNDYRQRHNNRSLLNDCHRYQHEIYCQCSICELQKQLRAHQHHHQHHHAVGSSAWKHSTSVIGVIAEETDEEENDQADDRHHHHHRPYRQQQQNQESLVVVGPDHHHRHNSYHNKFYHNQHCQEMMAATKITTTTTHIGKNKKMDKIVPFDKPEHLQNLWQEPAGVLELELDAPDVIKRTPHASENVAAKRKEQKHTKPNEESNVSRRGSKSPPPSICFDDYTDDDEGDCDCDHHNNDGRCRSSASNFLRTHQLRSSCPPPSRPRRRSKTPSNRSVLHFGGNNNKSRQPPSVCANNQTSKSSYQLNQLNRIPGGIVDKMQSKLSSVRKSWLFSLFQPNNGGNDGNSSRGGSMASSKEKQKSKWTKSDDFEAEFFDRQHRELTENLISRRSPLMFGTSNIGQPPQDSKRIDLNLSRQMSLDPGGAERQYRPQHHADRRSHPSATTNNTSTTTTSTTTNIAQTAYDKSNINFSNHKEWPSSSTSSSVIVHRNHLDVSRRQRPRSACLDTYMLRMRNGNFIEFTVDDENKDESCSIISSTAVPNGQLIGDYSFPSSQISGDTFISNQYQQSQATPSVHSSHTQYSSGSVSTFGTNTTTATATNNNNNSSSIQQHPCNHNRGRQSRRPASIVSDVIHPHWLQPPQPNLNASAMATSVTSNNSSSVNFSSSSSPSLPKRNNKHQQQAVVSKTTNSGMLCAATAATATTSSSISSASSSGIQMAAWSNNTTSSSVGSMRIESTNQTAAHLYWPVRNFSEISMGPNTTAADVIVHFLTSQLYGKIPLANNRQSKLATTSPPPQPLTMTQNMHAYAMRLICRSLNPNDHQWLHPSQNMQQFIEQNSALFEKGWTLELRIRYLPANLQQLFDEDSVTFRFLYEQVLEEFLMLDLPANCLLSYQDQIIELGCLELRRSNPFLTPQGLEKSSNIDTLESEIHKFLPASLIASVKPKQLRKLIKNKYKKIFAIQHKSAMMEFFRIVPQFVDFQREIFRCSLGDSAWSVPIDLMIGPDIGMVYCASNSSQQTPLAKTFETIECIHIVSHSTINRSTADRSSNNDNSLGSGSGCTIPNKKILLNIRIKNEDDTLVLSCASFAMAQSLADLLDGYHRLATNSCASIWLNAAPGGNKSGCGSNSTSGQNSLKSNSSGVIIEPRKAEIEFIMPQIATTRPTIAQYCHASISNVGGDSVKSSPSSTPLHTKTTTTPGTAIDDLNNDDEGDYSNPMEVCPEICRDRLQTGDLIGNGQFGDVYRGTYRAAPNHSIVSVQSGGSNGSNSNAESEPISVAVKISRLQSGSPFHATSFDYNTADQKLISEASRMYQLEHPNIIKLIGICSASPVYVVMELAQYGELRDFLQKHGASLEQRLLIEYSIQISSALAYLESKQFVHRDIAARNILVFSFECVKLADFGLSRVIDDASYYMATNSKLPIKWMAPESINFRRFTTASDVWMFAVCMWEIFMLGKKPFPGVKNPDVIGLLEAGVRLPKPTRCPESLHNLMLKCWRYEPDKRPSFRYLKRHIKEVQQSELGLVGAIAHMDLNQGQHPSPKSSLSSLSGYNDKYHLSSSASSSLSRHGFAVPQKTATTGSNSSSSSDSCRLSHCKSSSSLSAGLSAEKIKEILSQQRRQMEEDSKWLTENGYNWNHFNQFSSLTSTKSSNADIATTSCNEANCSDSTTTSVYEDADCGGIKNDDLSQTATSSAANDSNNSLHKHFNKSEQQLYSLPNLMAANKNAKRMSYGDESYNSFKSTTSIMATSSGACNADRQHSPSNSSLDSTEDRCGLSVSLKKFFKHNRLTDSKMRQSMMQRVSYRSADIDRTGDAVYLSTIFVINSVQQLLKGVQEVNTSEYVDLVKNVGQELRNLLANVDILLVSLPEDSHWTIEVAQKKLTSDMNNLVEAMKKTIMHSETPLEESYKQNMLETTYVLVIDSKNFLDTLDEIRIQQKQEQKTLNDDDVRNSLLDDTTTITTTDDDTTAIESWPKQTKQNLVSETIDAQHETTNSIVYKGKTKNDSETNESINAIERKE